MKKYIGLALAVCVLVLSGCAKVISDPLVRQSVPKVEFADLLDDPEKFKGRTVIYGGTIINVSAEGSRNLLEVLQRPLDYYYEPEINDQSQGRFLVTVDQFLDPDIYKKNRRITIAGEVKGSETGRIGDSSYQYPVLIQKEDHLWPVTSSYNKGPRFNIGFGVFGSF